ncbi:MAG: RNA polymerase subunit sigma-70 [Planctomycetes bacterium]|nr:RNA polymerase subunit sigma-70 [Planctomycetota bacterium]
MRPRPEDGGGDPGATLPAEVYAELKRVAAAAMRGERDDHTLQATALVHEAWLRLADQDGVVTLPLRALAAQAMRHVLVDHARARTTAKRGGRRARLTLTGLDLPAGSPDADLLAVHEALGELERLDPVQGRVVETRFFGGLTLDETAEVMDLSRDQVKRAWRMARAWLHRRLKDDGPSP